MGLETGSKQCIIPAMKLICAPMATISHPAFRIMIEKFGGCDEYYNEMINAPSLLNMGPFEKYYIDPSPVPEKMVWQLTGKDIRPMVEASKIVAALPGLFVDLNMGCCAPEIVRSGAGIAWMLKERSETESLVREVSSIVNSPEYKKKLSVKLRLGDENFTDEGFFSFCDMLVQNGVSRITLHPRTKKEKYRDKPRYEYVQKLCERYKGQKVEIILNGDIKDEQSLKKALSVCPDCSGIMVGRGAVSKPWIFKELRNALDSSEVSGTADTAAERATANSTGGGVPAESIASGALPENRMPVDGMLSDSSPAAGTSNTTVDALTLALSYIDDVMRYQPPEFWKTRLQRFFTYYSENFSFAHYLKSGLLNAQTPEDSRKILEEYFKKVPQDLNLGV